MQFSVPTSIALFGNICVYCFMPATHVLVGLNTRYLSFLWDLQITRPHTSWTVMTCWWGGVWGVRVSSNVGETYISTYPTTQCHISEEQSPLQHSCENPKPQKYTEFYKIFYSDNLNLKHSARYITLYLIIPKFVSQTITTLNTAASSSQHKFQIMNENFTFCPQATAEKVSHYCATSIQRRINL